VRQVAAVILAAGEAMRFRRLDADYFDVVEEDSDQT
jgi:CTP:molybdopterin cytidylyltransferase MocA